MRYVNLLFVSALLAACGGDETPATTETTAARSFDVDAARITVSGVSSGAMMATQFHVAHSSLVSGAALLAGGPYYCAKGELTRGLGVCVKGGDLGLDALLEYARAVAAAGQIDDPANLRDDPVWLFHGSKDIAVHLDSTHAARDFYTAFKSRIAAVVEDVPAAHGFPTVDTGVACDALEAPYLNACDFDAAGKLLAALSDEVGERASPGGDFIDVPQPGADEATMLPNAVAYVPAACANGEACGVHIAFHGCQQSTELVGDAFVRGAGYNEWADSRRLIVLYPQVGSSKVMPMNPLGCWDWWGYTDENYATKGGAQITVVKAMLDSLAGKTL
jgi:poly(3-hydroxybutyrate) depolymerase